MGVVEACASAGTHYADLNGEVLFMREAIDRFDAIAAANGARIVHSCGFDSIPSDLGVQLLHETATADGAGGLRGNDARRAGDEGRPQRRHDRDDEGHDRGRAQQSRAGAPACRP